VQSFISRCRSSTVAGSVTVAGSGDVAGCNAVAGSSEAAGNGDAAALRHQCSVFATLLSRQGSAFATFQVCLWGKAWVAQYSRLCPLSSNQDSTQAHQKRHWVPTKRPCAHQIKCWMPNKMPACHQNATQPPKIIAGCPPIFQVAHKMPGAYKKKCRLPTKINTE